MRELFVIVVICWMNLAHGQVHVFDSTQYWQDMRSSTFILNEDVAEGEVLSGKADRSFIPVIHARLHDRGYSRYWLLVRMKALQVNNWQLLLKNPGYRNATTARHDSVEVFYVDANRQLLKKEYTGLFVPMSAKLPGTPAGFAGVSFSGLPAGEIFVYIKITDRFSENSHPSFCVLRKPAVFNDFYTGGTMLWILFSVSLVFTVLSFFFYFFVREKAYLWFGLYALTLSHHYLILHADVPFVSWYIPEHPWFVTSAWTVLTMGGFALFCLFGRSFINLPALSKQVDKAFRLLLTVTIAFTIFQLCWELVSRKPFFLTPAALIIVGAALAFFIRFAFFNNVLTRTFVAGAAWLMVFTILGFLYNIGTVSLPFIPWPVGQLGQFIIFAIGLAYKIRLNEQARAAAARITEMDNLKSKFFANISHEFRTPLTLIQGPLQLIEDQEPKKDGTVNIPVRQVKTMRRNTDRLLELVNQLLDLSKIDAGNMKLQVIRGDVLQFITVLAASFESMAERKQVHFHVHVAQQSAIAFFDKDKVEKIFTNLLGNAFKFTPAQGTISVTVEIHEERLRLSIEDNGLGIPKKEVDKVFDRFYQVEQTGDNGSGIGLALVKELVDLYRGQLSVSSEPGKGTRFRVSLPVSKEAFKDNEFIFGEWQNTPMLSAPSIAEAIPFEQSGASVNPDAPLVLIVEDNPDLLNFTRETIMGEYNVITASNGKEGLRKALDEIPDVIISDVMMPEMDGFIMTQKLKQDERTSHIPVVLLTAKAGQQHKIDGLSTGADDYLCKPFDAKELHIRISNLVQQRKLLRQKFAVSIQLRPAEMVVQSVDEQFLVNIMEAIEKNLDDDSFGVEQLAREAAMSRSQLHRKLSALLDRSPSELIRQTRLLRAKELLQQKGFSPSEVAYKVGFSSHTYFSKCFKDEFGITPSEASVNSME